MKKKDYRKSGIVLWKLRSTGRYGVKRVYEKDSTYHKKFQKYCWNNGFYAQFMYAGGKKPVYSCRDKETSEMFGLF